MLILLSQEWVMVNVDQQAENGGKDEDESELGIIPAQKLEYTSPSRRTLLLT